MVAVETKEAPPKRAATPHNPTSDSWCKQHIRGNLLRYVSPKTVVSKKTVSTLCIYWKCIYQDPTQVEAGLEAPAAAVPATAARDPEAILKRKKSGRTNCKRKQIRAKRNCVRLANFTWCRRSELNINLNSWNAPLTNLHRFLSCGDKNNMVSCTFNVQQTVPLKFFLSTDPSWVGRSNETSSNQSQGTLNQKKGKQGALLQHQGANYKMIVKSEPPQRRVRVQLLCHFHCDKHVFIQNAHFFISNL